jgi:hypothetical protein
MMGNIKCGSDLDTSRPSPKLTPGVPWTENFLVQLIASAWMYLIMHTVLPTPGSWYHPPVWSEKIDVVGTNEVLSSNPTIASLKTHLCCGW